jgi:chemotaxis protein methyltransferase CheR
MIKISPDEYKVTTEYIYELSGIMLAAGKTYLVETRLSPLVEECGCASFSEFYFKAKADRSRALENRIINAITTRETLFFRDTAPFELLQYKILPELIDVKRAQGSIYGKIPIRIWSAACSTGQEAYSAAMALKEMLPDMSAYDIRILGTDISDAAVAAASYGTYNRFEIERGLSQGKLSKYFETRGDDWKVKDEIRLMTSFRKFNLFHDLHALGQFDIVFCRNVAIYFTAEDRKQLFHRIADILPAHAALIIGSSEYLAGVCDRFKSNTHMKSVYYTLASHAGVSSGQPSHLSRNKTPQLST